MKNLEQKIQTILFISFFALLTLPIVTHAGYFYVEQTGDDVIVANDDYSQYIIEYNYECYSSDFLEGDTIYIDSNYTPLFGDTIVTSGYFEKTCEVTNADEVNLKKYYVEKVLDSDDKIIVTDKLGASYIVEYGIGCGLGMWRYEGKNIDIDISGSFLDGIGDRIYQIDRSDDCKVWDAEELSGNYSGGETFSYGSSVDAGTLEELLQSSCPANSSYTGNGCSCNNGYVVNASGNACVTVTQACQNQYGINSYGSGDSCYCSQGYEWNSTETACVLSVVSQQQSTAPAQNQQQVTPPTTPTSVVNQNADFTVSETDIEKIEGEFKVDTNASFRKCPSIQCSLIRSYVEGSIIEVIGVYKKDEWYQIRGATDAGGSGETIVGWMHKSLLSPIEKTTESNDEGGAISTDTTEVFSKQESTDNKSFFGRIWKTILGWFK